jgi:hypothetical protein
MSDVTFFLLNSRADFFPSWSSIGIRVQIRSFLPWSYLRAIKTGCRTPPLYPISQRSVGTNPRRLLSEHRHDRPAIPSSAPSFASSSAPFLREVRSHALYFIPVLFFREVTLWIMRSRSPAMALPRTWSPA